MNPQPRVFLVAAEESGDRLGAALMRALVQRTGEGVEFHGVGGHEMEGEGLQSLFPLGELAIIGFNEIIGRMSLIRRRIRQTADAVLAARPDVLVIIDSPDFTHRVARRVRRADPSIPIVNFVPPAVWAWRPWRARSMRRYVDHAMALLPFEPEVFRKLGGPPCTFVGHPLADQLDLLRPNAEEARRRLQDPPVLLVLPGSRGSEIHRLAAVFGEAIGLLRDAAGPFELVLPTVPRLLDRVKAETAAWPVQPKIVVDPQDKRAALRVARAALAKSGTVTLELALAGIPMVTAYRVSLFEEMMVRLLVTVETAILPNLVLGERAVPELLQRDCTPAALAQTLAPLLRDSPERQAQYTAFSKLDAIMELGSLAPASRAAEIVLASRRPPFATDHRNL